MHFDVDDPVLHMCGQKKKQIHNITKVYREKLKKYLKLYEDWGLTNMVLKKKGNKVYFLKEF